MQQTKEDFYNMLNETGELQVLFDGMTGDWKKDKVKFCANYDNVMESLINDNIIDDTGSITE